MNADPIVFITDNLLDYAVAAAAHGPMGVALGVGACHPLLATVALRARLDLIARHFRVRPVDFADVEPGATDAAARSQAIARKHFASAKPVLVSLDAGTADLARGLARALAGGRPLVVGSEHGAAAEEAAPPAAAHGSVVAARAASEAAVPAAFYAAATGKQLLLVEKVDDPATLFAGGEIVSALLVDDFSAFGKPALERISAWTQAEGGPAGGAGILTAYSTAELSGLCFRLLANRHRHEPAAMPGGLGRIALHDMARTLYYIVSEHGNERHIQHGEDVLCGAFPPELKQRETRFDCEPGCLYPRRVRSSEIPVHTVIVLSCDTATVGDGIAPPEYNVLLNLLHGFCTGVIAPCKHAQINEGNALLADALVRAGYSLGVITARMNSVSAFGTAPDYPYVLVGDPDVVIVPSELRTPSVALHPEAGGLTVECESLAGPLIDCRIPHAALGAAASAPALIPISEELRSSDVHFTWRTVPGTDELGLLIFGHRDFPRAPLRFRLQAALPVTTAQRQMAGEIERGLRNLVLFGFKPQDLQAMVDIALAEIRLLCAYPRPIEVATAGALLPHLDALLQHRAASARHAVLKQMILMLSDDGVWISHLYMQFYPKIARVAAPEGFDGWCRICDNSLTLWRYEDACTGLRPREVAICPRCGIVADYAWPIDFQILHDRIPVLEESHPNLLLKVRNRSARRMDASFFLQANYWKEQRIAVDPIMVDATLDPGEEREITMKLTMDSTMPDDLLALQAFVLTDTFDLSCFTRRLLTLRRQPTPIVAS